MELDVRKDSSYTPNTSCFFDPEDDLFGTTYVPNNPSLVLDTSLWKPVTSCPNSTTAVTSTSCLPVEGLNLIGEETEKDDGSLGFIQLQPVTTSYEEEDQQRVEALAPFDPETSDLLSTNQILSENQLLSQPEDASSSNLILPTTTTIQNSSSLFTNSEFSVTNDESNANSTTNAADEIIQNIPNNLTTLSSSSNNNEAESFQDLCFSAIDSFSQILSPETNSTNMTSNQQHSGGGQHMADVLLSLKHAVVHPEDVPLDLDESHHWGSNVAHHHNPEERFSASYNPRSNQPGGTLTPSPTIGSTSPHFSSPPGIPFSVSNSASNYGIDSLNHSWTSGGQSNVIYSSGNVIPTSPQSQFSHHILNPEQQSLLEGVWSTNSYSNYPQFSPTGHATTNNSSSALFHSSSQFNTYLNGHDIGGFYSNSREICSDYLNLDTKESLREDLLGKSSVYSSSRSLSLFDSKRIKNVTNEQSSRTFPSSDEEIPLLHHPLSPTKQLASPTRGLLNHPNSPDSSTDNTKNVCGICGKTYARPSTLKTHMRTHSGERPYRCFSCNKSFSQAANLTAHCRTHSGEKPFHCGICDRKFSQSSSVTTHMRTHSGERPYRCRLCKKAFSDSSTLTKHLRIHSGEKPYQCKLCHLRFSQSGNLNRHMRIHAQSGR